MTAATSIDRLIVFVLRLLLIVPLLIRIPIISKFSAAFDSGIQIEKVDDIERQSNDMIGRYILYVKLPNLPMPTVWIINASTKSGVP